MDLTLHILDEERVVLANHIAGRVVFADEEKAIYAIFPRAVHGSTARTYCPLPDQLGEMSRGFGEPGWRFEVVLGALVAPAIHRRRHVPIPGREVFAIRAAGVLPLAVGGPGLGVGGEGSVPGQSGGVVLVAVEIGAVEEVGLERFWRWYTMSCLERRLLSGLAL